MGYDPALGRFTQPDTMVPLESQGIQAWDRYAYVNNSPVNYTDPSGHKLSADDRFEPPPPYRPTPTPSTPPITPVLPTQPPSPIFSDGSDLTVVGYEYIVHWNQVDWLDVGISVVGFAGDIGLVSVLAGDAPGVGVWGITEAIEFVDIAGLIYDASEAMNMDFSGLGLSLGEDLFEELSKVPPSVGKGVTRIGSLAPVVGAGFDVINIGWNIFIATERISIVKHIPTMIK